MATGINSGPPSHSGTFKMRRSDFLARPLPALYVRRPMKEVLVIGHRNPDTDAICSAIAPLADGAAWFDRLYRKERGLMKVILQPG